ncbi:MAG: hypothetical protein KGH60_04470 [Candidatus Micrarchaeota archaeon]|nr:hypothetical protein [Candidatus Micrarchaeota archaeon]
MNLDTLKKIYGPEFLVLNIAFAAMYYLLLTGLLSIQQQGVPFTSVPLILIYALSISSSVPLTIAVYSISNTRRNNAKLSASVSSIVTTVGGGLVAGCGCQAALLTGIVALFTTTGGALSVSTVAAENAPALFAVLIVINIFVAAYYLNKLSKPMCRMR